MAIDCLLERKLHERRKNDERWKAEAVRSNKTDKCCSSEGEGNLKGSKLTGGSHEIRRISVCNVLDFYLVCLLLSWGHRTFRNETRSSGLLFCHQYSLWSGKKARLVNKPLQDVFLRTSPATKADSTLQGRAGHRERRRTF